MGKPAFSAQEAGEVAQEIEDGMKEKHGLVIKAQIHAGGRGRGTFKESNLQGGVHLVKNVADVRIYVTRSYRVLLLKSNRLISLLHK